jgi:hypothetical protein
VLELAVVRFEGLGAEVAKEITAISVFIKSHVLNQMINPFSLFRITNPRFLVFIFTKQDRK